MHIVLEDDWTCIYTFRESSARRICEIVWYAWSNYSAIESAELFRTKQIFGTPSRLWLGWCLSLHKTQNKFVSNVEEASGNTRWDYARGALNMRPSWALIHKCLYESQQHVRPTSRPKQSRWFSYCVVWRLHWVHIDDWGSKCQCIFATNQIRWNQTDTLEYEGFNRY